MDLLISSLLLVVLMPLMLGIALLVRCRIGGPVLFRQTRPGRGASPLIFASFAPCEMSETHRGGGYPMASGWKAWAGFAIDQPR